MINGHARHGYKLLKVHWLFLIPKKGNNFWELKIISRHAVIFLKNTSIGIINKNGQKYIFYTNMFSLVFNLAKLNCITLDILKGNLLFICNILFKMYFFFKERHNWINFFIRNLSWLTNFWIHTFIFNENY